MSHTPLKQGALDGLRVLDLSGGTAGAVAGMLLGDLGALVVRGNPVGVCHDDPAGAVMWDRNKLCTTVDWTASSDVQRLVDFLATADLCITSDEQTVDALGLDAEHLAATFPRLVHLSLSSWPSLSGSPCGGVELDSLLASITGLAARQSSFDGGPVDFVYPHIQYVQGLWGATTGLAALIERERSGRGQRVETNGVHGALLTGTAIMAIDPSEPPRDTNVGAGGPAPIYSKYQCADGKWLFFAALMPKFQDSGFKALGISDILSDERILESSVAGGGPVKMRTRLYAAENRDWLRERIAAAFSKRPRDEWLELLQRSDCPAAAVGDRGEWLDHPQMIALGQRKSVRDPQVGEVVMPGHPIELFNTLAIEPAARRFIRVSEIPLMESRAAEQRPTPGDSCGWTQGPLDGTRVLDLGTVLAGPLASMLLASLGAEVIKVETPVGDTFRMTGWHYNRGHASVAIDLMHPVGKDCFEALSATTDIVLDNYRPGVLERLGIEYESLCKIRPDIISVSISAFGHIGELSTRPGFDPLLQAMSGMMTAQGGSDEPVFYTVAVNDIAAAGSAAFGACAALFRRARTGEGDRVRTSLAAASAFMQSGELVRYEGRPPARSGGRDFKGSTAGTHFYRTVDGWIRVSGATRQQLEDSGLLHHPGATDDECVALAAAAVEVRNRQDVLSALADVGITAVAVRSVLDFVTDDYMVSQNYIEALQNGDRTVHLPGHYARFSRTQGGSLRRPPGVGEHSRELLLNAGVATDVLERAVDCGVVATGNPLTTLPLIDYR
jgi:crotonobetainyl-CoA:carnitine CoA-transferase CaiB-like acyl-CoA transferase